MSSKKRSRARPSLGSTPRSSGRRSLDSTASSDPVWSACADCGGVSVPSPHHCSSDGSGGADLPVCHIRDRQLLGARWWTPGLQLLQPPPWPCVCLMAAETAVACRLRCGDAVQLQLSADDDWQLVARVWPDVSYPADAVGLTGPAAPDKQPGQERLSRLAPIVCCATPARRVLFHTVPAVEVSFLQERRFGSRLQYELQGAVLAVGVRHRLTYLGTPLTLQVVEMRIDAADDGQLSGRMAQMSLQSGGVRWGVVSDDTELCVVSELPEKPVAPPAVQLFGLDSVLEYVQRLVVHVCSANPTQLPSSLPAPRAVLLYGPSGCGKSALGRWLAARHLCVSVSCSQMAAPSEVSEQRLRDDFSEARRRRPCVIFLDDVHALPDRVTSLLTSLLDAADVGVAVVATALRPDDVSALLRRAGRLDRELELPPPDPTARCQLLTQLLANSCQLSPDQLREAAGAAHGFVGADLRAAVAEARLAAGEGHLQLPELLAALRRIRPSAVRQLQVEVPSVRWSDIAGQQELKLRLRQAVEWPLRHPDAFRRLGIAPPRGLLMYGPPGCSKTMIARALATESGLNFIAIKGPELFNKWVGESERAVRDVFRRARQAAPSVVFIDELDALAVRRRGDSGGGGAVGERVLAQLLTEMDGLAGLRDVTVVAATNRPDLLDPALLRPGRLDALVHVPLPDLTTRLELLQLRLARVPTAADVQHSWLAAETCGYSGAELVAVCHEAALRALQRDLDAAVVTRDDFSAALQTVQPRVKHYHHVYAEFQLSRDAHTDTRAHIPDTHIDTDKIPNKAHLVNGKFGTEHTNTPDNTPTDNTPDNTPTYNAPDNTPTDNAPDNTPADNAPDITPTDNAPDNTPPYNAPDNTPTDNVPDNTPADNAPDNTPADNGEYCY